MSDKNYSHITSDRRYAESIQAMVREMVFERDPRELDAYRKLIRKNTSVFRRTYLTGYLFKLLQENGRRRGGDDERRRGTRTRRRGGVGRHDHSPGGVTVIRDRTGRDGGERTSRSGGERTSRREERIGRDEERTSRSEERRQEHASVTPNIQNGVVSLHVNCGRLHGLTEDDLRSLVETETSSAVIASIQDIRLYDKYSFIYLAAENAQTIIDNLTGLSRFNRDLLVSYSKKNIQ